MNRVQGYFFGLRHDLQFAAHVFAHKRCWRWIESCYSGCPECEAEV